MEFACSPRHFAVYFLGVGRGVGESYREFRGNVHVLTYVYIIHGELERYVHSHTGVFREYICIYIQDSYEYSNEYWYS